MPSFAELSVGDELPPLFMTPGRSELVKFAAASGDFNPLHFDPDFEQAVEIGDNIVHGALKCGAMGRLVSDWLRHDGWIRRIWAQYRGMDRRGQRITCRGRITSLHQDAGRNIVELELWTERENGERTTIGAAEVILN